MIRFFPMPYPDESLYSIFARYDKMTGNNNYRTTVSELIGTRNCRINFYFPNNLKFLCDQLVMTVAFNCTNFIQEHTIIPIYKSFVPDDRFNNAVSNFINPTQSTLHSMMNIGFISNSLYRNNGFAYCIECIKEDKTNFGEAYIHRSHQVDGYLICSKHQSILNFYQVSKAFESTIFHDINKLNLNYEKATNKYHKELLYLSFSIDELFENYHELPNYTLTKYCNILYEQGYYINNSQSRNCSIDQVKLDKDFINYYTKDFLIYLSSYPDINKEHGWLRSITSIEKRPKSIHPIRNLLFINFLFGSVKNFIYFRSKNLYISYKQKGKSNVIDKSKKSYNKLKEKHQSKLIMLLEEEPNLMRTQIRRKLEYSYQWLSNNENEWLEATLPKPFTQSYSRVDWHSRDSQYFTEINSAIQNILNNNTLIRITTYTLSKYINYPKLNKVLNNIPKTMKLIEKYKETYPEFYKRKIKAIVQVLSDTLQSVPTANYFHQIPA